MSKSQKRDKWGIPLDNFKGLQRYHVTAHTFEMGAHAYTATSLTPLEQVHIARRLAPVLLGALKPEEGRKAIIARLASMTSLAASQAENAAQNSDNEQAVADALDLATSIFSAAAASDEETVNAIIRKCMGKISRANDTGAGLPVWDAKDDIPRYEDIDGFKTIALTIRYLFEEFQESIVEYLTSLDLKPGPALMAGAGNRPRPPGAPGAERE